MNYIFFHKKYSLFFICLFAIVCSVFAETSKGVPFIKNYKPQETNNITHTWTLIQSRTGILYSGNGFGISEFDGNSWRWMRISNNSSIYSLFEDRDGTIFSGAINEIGFLEISNQGYHQYKSLNHLIPEGFKTFDVVWQIARFKQYVVFMSDYQIFLYDGDRINVLKSNTKFQRILLIKNKLYVYENEIGLSEITPDLKFSKVESANEEPILQLVSMEKWDENGIIFLDQSGNLYTFKNREFKKFDNNASNFIVKARPYSFLKLKNNNYAVGTVLDGIVVFNKSGEIIEQANRESGLDNNKIHCMAEDESGNLWVGHENGMSYIEFNSPIRYLPHQLVSGSGYSIKMYNNNLYLGTSEGLFTAGITTSNHGILIERPEFINGTEGQVWNLDVIKDDLFIHQFNGLSKINNKKVERISQGTGSWKIAEIKNYPNYYLQGTYEGLVLWSNSTGRLTMIKKLEGFNESSRLFEVDNQNNIWVSHGFKGLYKVKTDAEFKKIRSVSFYGKEKGFPSNLGINVTKFHDSIFFSSEYGGIYQYVPEQDSFVEYHGLEKFIGRKALISKLYEDSKKNIWFICKDKMGVIKNNNTLISEPFGNLYTKFITSFETVFPLDNNQVVFGINNGYILFNMNISKNYQLNFNTYIRNVEFIPSDSSVFRGYKGKDYKKPEFAYKNHSLRFTFAAPFFEQNDAIKYSCYLEGYDDSWSVPSSVNTKDYLKLPGGNYKFHVRAINNYGVEGQEYVYEFYLHPHFTRTWWAYLCYIVLFISGLATFIYFYTKGRERKHRRLALQKEKEIMELKHQKLLDEYEHKNSELSTLTLQVVKKNDVLNEIKQKLEGSLDKQINDLKKDVNSVIRVLEHEISEDKDWEAIELYFNNVYKGFLKKLRDKYPELRSTELKLCAYIRMDLSNKEIAALMNNTIRGVEAYRYRLRKSLNLKREESLKEFLFNFE